MGLNTINKGSRACSLPLVSLGRPSGEREFSASVRSGNTARVVLQSRHCLVLGLLAGLDKMEQSPDVDMPIDLDEKGIRVAGGDNGIVLAVEAR